MIIVFFKLSYRLSAAADFQDIEYIQLLRAMSIYVMKFLEKNYDTLPKLIAVVVLARIAFSAVVVFVDYLI